MMTESATTSAFTVAARMAGGVSMRTTSKSGRIVAPPRRSSRLTSFCLREVVGLDINGVRQEFQMRTNLNEVPANVGHLVNQETMGGGAELVQVDTETGAAIALLVTTRNVCAGVSDQR